MGEVAGFEDAHHAGYEPSDESHQHQRGPEIGMGPGKSRSAQAQQKQDAGFVDHALQSHGFAALPGLGECSITFK